MTLAPLSLYGDPVLRRRAQPVGVFNTPELLELLQRMFEAMYASKGIGLAAPQIGVDKRIAVIDVSGDLVADPQQMIVLINPEIVAQSGSQLEDEGCLSLPGFHARVARPASITVRAQNFKGEWSEPTGTGLLARAIAHELDHLSGVLFIDHLSPLKRSTILGRIRNRQKAGTWVEK